MGGIKKRKHASVEEQEDKRQSTVQRNIHTFGTVSKFHNAENGLKKRKTVHQRQPTPPPTAIASPKANKKRKRALDVVEEREHEGDVETPLAQENIFKRFADPKMASTPRNKRFKNAAPPSPMETPSKSAMAMFESLKLDTASKSIPFALHANQRAYDTPPDTPDLEKDHELRWAPELKDLMQLHAAFLSALSLYYSHNGTTSPVDVKTLLPMITKTWKKRTVSLDDLRILLAIGPEEESGFALQDFGRVGVCLVKLRPRGRTVKRAASYVDEVGLNARFEEALNGRWTKWLATTAKENQLATVFLHQLPTAEITKNDSVEKTAPLFARGQQRLADIKAGQAAVKSEPIEVTQSEANTRSTLAVQNRGTSLLDRVLAKQAHNASLPAGPTKEQIERRAALHRVEDIARVLHLLVGVQQRCSLSMPAMVQQLQQSLRNPISKEEVGRCLNVMADEISPAFVSLVTSGSVTGVVIKKGGWEGLEVVRQRVERACA